MVQVHILPAFVLCICWCSEVTEAARYDTRFAMELEPKEFDNATRTTRCSNGCSSGCEGGSENCKNVAFRPCKYGWWGKSTTEANMYTCDKVCNRKCYQGRVDGHCDKGTGLCDCKDPWKSPLSASNKIIIEDQCTRQGSEHCLEGFYSTGECVFPDHFQKEKPVICDKGWWGPSNRGGWYLCDKQCSYNCMDTKSGAWSLGACHPQTSGCRCAPGYYSKLGAMGGDKVHGKCRSKCNKGCAHGCFDISGDCRSKEGHETCKKGYWGPGRMAGYFSCDQECAPNCNGKCQEEDGLCSCKLGFWSPNAKAICSLRCEGCRHSCYSNGECRKDTQPDVCVTGWWGGKPGHFTCDKKCDEDCNNYGVKGLCKNTDGSCTKGLGDAGGKLEQHK